MATIIIPTPLRKFTGNQSKLDISAGTIEEAVRDLSSSFPDIKKHLLDEKGQIRSFLNIFVGEDDIRDLENEKTSLQANTVVSIVPAIAGGIQSF
jgi:molybdopterin converting factor small subunit